MSTATAPEYRTEDDRPTREFVRTRDASRALPLAGRILYSLIFILSVPNHFSSRGVDYAAAAGVPFPNVLVPISGILALLGGLSVLLGYKTKLGAWLLVVFLIPVTFWMHRFWDVADPQLAQMQMANFMKNISMLGGALVLAYFGAGPLSIDARVARTEVRRRAAEIPA